MREKGWKRADLARAIGGGQKAAHRLLDLHHASRWDQVDAAFRALGKVLVPQIAPAWRAPAAPLPRQPALDGVPDVGLEADAVEAVDLLDAGG